MAKRSAKARQVDLFGEVVEEEPGTALVPLDFEGSSARIIMIKGEPWWVAADVCRILWVANPSLAVRGRERRRDDGSTYRSEGLDDDEWGIANVNTPSGEQQMLIVNESGLYGLAFKSQNPDAKRFRKWITSEILPALRKGGTYSVPRRDDRVSKMARKLRSDRETAKVRCEQVEVNKATRSRVFTDGGGPRQLTAIYRSPYRGQFGVELAELRRLMGLGPKQSPLDHMTVVPLAQNCHAKVFAERLVAEAAKKGAPITLADQPWLFEQTARRIAEADLEKIGSGWGYGVVDDPRRGKVLDLVENQLPGPQPAPLPPAKMSPPAHLDPGTVEHNRWMRRHGIATGEV